MEPRSRVVIIGTGGTIAGVATSKDVTVGYSDAQLSVEGLASSVHGIEKVADVQLYEFDQLGSEYMESTMLWKLAKLINFLFLQRDVDGIVITHGSDTVEESALFLDFVCKNERPIVFVAAMRPATAMSADGPFNLLQAVAIAASPASRGRGVMITWSNHIGAAASTTKSSTRTVDAFKASDRGLLGVMQDTKPIFYTPPFRMHHQGLFDQLLSYRAFSWPKVMILYGYQDMDERLLSAAVDAGAQGIIIACTGDGTLPQNWARAEVEMNGRGIPVVRSSRVWSTYVAPRSGCFTAGLFNPQKARIVLQLALSVFGAATSSQLQTILDPLAKALI